ncbi:hypothetical protein GGP97_002833, partial [Salinibacter ruber]|nr:hypothetical protein [Salinibacter ruber]
MYEPVFRYVRSITSSAEAAQDVAQDTFIRLWEARESLRTCFNFRRVDSERSSPMQLAPWSRWNRYAVR